MLKEYLEPFLKGRLLLFPVCGVLIPEFPLPMWLFYIISGDQHSVTRLLVNDDDITKIVDGN